MLRVPSGTKAEAFAKLSQGLGTPLLLVKVIPGTAQIQGERKWNPHFSGEVDRERKGIESSNLWDHLPQ
jgi:hypothetical protein